MMHANMRPRCSVLLLSSLLCALVASGCSDEPAGFPAAPVYDAGTDAAGEAGGHADAKADVHADADADADASADGAADADAKANTLSLMTWNLEDYPLSSKTPDQAASIVAQLRPDLIAVQEVADPTAFAALESKLPAGYQIVINDDPGAFLRVALVTQSQRVTVSEVETLFKNDAYAFPRPPLKARVLAQGVGSGSFDFVVVVVHLKAQLNQASQDRRKDACIKLDAWLSAELAKGGEQDYVVIGDFNDELDDPPQWNVFGPLLSKSSTYTFLTSAEVQAGKYTYLPFQSFLDHVLVTSDALVEYGAGSTNVLELEKSVTDYENGVSDHRPVLSVFQSP